MVTYSKKIGFFEQMSGAWIFHAPRAWNLHAEEPRPKTPKDVFEYGEFNGELRMIISRTDCCYLAILLFVLT